MAIRARDYQIEAVDSIFRYFSSASGNPVVAMPTGTGKSVVIALFLHAVYHYYPTQRVLMLTHVKELIRQNLAKLLELWPMAPASVYSAGLNEKRINKITFAGIASIAKKAHLLGHVDLVLIDEAHLVSPSEATLYRQLLQALREVNPNVKVIGLTATPWRLGQGHIAGEADSLFTDVCFDITGLHAFNRLLQEGYLCPLVPKSTTATLNLDGVHVRGGEYIASELQLAVDKHEVTYAALREAVGLAGDRASWLLFCAGVEHAKHVADMLTQLGVQCKAVHKDLSDTERDTTIADWKAGRLRAVANNNILTTGIDHPGLDCIVMLRPTASTVLWVQMLGRGTRPLYAAGYNLDTAEGRLQAIAASRKQNCLVLDFAGNTRRLGPINDPVLPRRKGEKPGEAPIKLCPACATYNHASARYCVFCNAEFPAYAPKVQETASTDALIKDDTPIVEVFEVDHVTYSEHNKPRKPPSMRVTYYCGLRSFQEFVLFEHTDGFSRRKAAQWWKERAQGVLELPERTYQALAATQHLRAPTHLRVWINAQYPTILAACYDGTAFGTADAAAPPTPAPAPLPPTTLTDGWDDDIPF